MTDVDSYSPSDLDATSGDVLAGEFPDSKTHFQRIGEEDKPQYSVTFDDAGNITVINDTASTDIYTLSLHGALPIYLNADGTLKPDAQANSKTFFKRIGTE